ncbi:hypothetical protein UK23_30985 [Lentzea aerocolonigenes]|uniref:Uncharacterized protein n=2 Tax=Lentzea aerocolonigenes TaxID=68170 RepID=A0A0F0GKI7_LENAE|nr:hypothetical protein UK23_30985 [Lentzea aerocolonigenes]
MDGTYATHRALAVLRAVAEGRVEMTCSAESDMFVDDLALCDQQIAHHLAHSALLEPACEGIVGMRVPARLTARGMTHLAAHVNDAGIATNASS